MSESRSEHGEWELGLERPLETRRANRIGTQLWVRVGGVDAATRARGGNLSVTGLYIATDEPVGSPGDLVWLHLASLDKSRTAQIMARVARVVRQDDRHRGARVVGAGFEFLPLARPASDVVDLVRHATSVALRSDGSVPFDRDCVVRLGRPEGRSTFGRPRSLRRDGLVLSVPAPLAIGEMIHFEGGEQGPRNLDVSGRVATCEAETPTGGERRHLVTVRFASRGDGANGESAERAVTALVEALVAPEQVLAPPPQLQDMSGLLSRVHLSSVLTLVEALQLDGIVTVANEQSSARIYVSEGRIVDAECDHSELAPHDLIGDLLQWQEGEFSVVSIPVKRHARVERSTGSLIGELLGQRHRDASVA